MCVADWRREHHISKAQSEMKAWRSTKHKDSDGRKIKKKGGRSVFKCLTLKRKRSCHSIQSYLASWTIYTFTVTCAATLPSHPLMRQRIYTSHAHPAPWHLCAWAERCTYIHSLTSLHGHLHARRHTSSHTKSGRGGENMQRSCETTWDSTRL